MTLRLIRYCTSQALLARALASLSTQIFQDMQEDTDGSPSEKPTPSHDSHVMVTTQPPSPAKAEVLEGSHHHEEEEEGKMLAMQRALQEAQEQTQLINSEYRKLLAEKEVIYIMIMPGLWSPKSKHIVPSGDWSVTPYSRK